MDIPPAPAVRTHLPQRAAVCHISSFGALSQQLFVHRRTHVTLLSHLQEFMQVFPI